MTDPHDRCMVCFRQPVPQALFPDFLAQCPMCGGWFCNRCGVKRGGREFCGSRCGDTYFYFGAEGESELVDDD
jgi:hypothetical protein